MYEPSVDDPTTSPHIMDYAAYLQCVYNRFPISCDNKWPPTPSKRYIKLATVEKGQVCRDEVVGDTLLGNDELLKNRKEA